MFNVKALGLMLCAIVFGVGAAVFANRWLQQQVGGNEIVAETTSAIVVAAKDISFGQTIEEIHLKTIQWPIESLPTDSFSDKGELIGKIANQRIINGEPIVEQRVVEKLAGSKLSALIGDNKRAITVRVNDVAGVAGFLLPGNRVDVLGTRMVDRRAMTKTVLQNVKVLAVDQKSNTKKDEPVVVRAVTLEADLDESLVLVKATNEGSVQLVLRNPDDLSTRIDPPKTTSKIAQAPKRRIKKALPQITIIRGTTINQTTLKN